MRDTEHTSFSGKLMDSKLLNFENQSVRKTRGIITKDTSSLREFITTEERTKFNITENKTKVPVDLSSFIEEIIQ